MGSEKAQAGLQLPPAQLAMIFDKRGVMLRKDGHSGGRTGRDGRLIEEVIQVSMACPTSFRIVYQTCLEVSWKKFIVIGSKTGTFRLCQLRSGNAAKQKSKQRARNR